MQDFFKNDIHNITNRLCNKSVTDFALLQGIHRTCMQKNVIDSLGEWNEEIQRARLAKHFSEHGGTLRFLFYNDQLLGTINFYPKNFLEKNETEQTEACFLEQLYIMPNFQKMGIGSYLLSKFLVFPEVRLSVLKNSLHTHKFYLNSGYQKYSEDEYQAYFKKTNTIKPKLKG